MAPHFQWFAGILIVISASAAGYGENPSGIRLVHHLLDETRFDKNVRPVRDHTRPIEVTIRMNLYQILEVNEPQQNVVLYVWMTQEWVDEFLGWEPEEFNGIDSIVLPYDKVWLPDTYLYNSLEMDRGGTERWISVILTTIPPPTHNPFAVMYGDQSAEKSGEPTEMRDYPVAKVTFQYPAMYKFSCKMYILYFPFDMQNCTLTFGSWTYDAAGIDFQPFSEQVMNESFVLHEEWLVVNFTMRRYSIKYTCCPVPYVLLRMYFIIQRKPLYYIVNLVVPTAIITLIAVIGFFMPTSTSGERSEKVNLGITTLLAMSILLLMVSDQMPTTSDFIPLMGWFFLIIIVLISVGTALSSVIILIHQKGRYGKRVSPRLRTLFFKYLARLCWMSLPQEILDDEESRKEVENMQTQSFRDTVPKDPLLGRSHLALLDPDGTRSLQNSIHRSSGPTPFRDTPNHVESVSPEMIYAKQLLGVRQQLRDLQIDLAGKEDVDLALLEWEFLTAVLDRVFLSLFVFTIFLVTLLFIVIGNNSDQDLDRSS